MKRTILVVCLLLVGLAAAGGGWFVFGRAQDPMAQARAALEKGDLRTAQIELRNAVKQDSNNREAQFRLGLVQLQLGDPVAAERQLKLALGLGQDPGTVRPAIAQAYLAQEKFRPLLDEFPPGDGEPAQVASMLVLRGIAQLRLDENDAARASFAEAERIAPQLPDAPLAAARLAVAEQDFATAERKVERTLALDGKRADALLLKGQLLNARGNRAAALTALDAAVERSGGGPLARLERANVLISMGQDAKAKADVDAALAVEPRSAAGTYLRAVLLTRAADYQAADQELVKLREMLPRFPRGNLIQAIVKFNLGQTEQAAEAAARHVARSPNDMEGVKLLARIDIAGGRMNKALADLGRAAAAGQADADILDLMGRAQAQTGRADQAVQSFQRAAALAPENADILTRLASSRLQMGDASGATGALERSLELSPTQSSAAENLVVAALAAGDLERAKAALDRLRQQAGETEAVGNLTGMLRMAQLDLDGAREQFANVVKAFPASTAAKLNLARLQLLQGRTADGERTLTDMLATDPANEQALSALVGVLLQDNRIGRAVTAVEAARAAAPANIGFTAVLADLYVRAGDPRKALTLLDQSIRGATPPPALVGARARAQVAAGLKNDAKETYRQILAANPGDLDARQRLMSLYLDDNELDPARATLRDGLRASPGNLGMLQALVAIEQRAGGINAALAAADQLKRDPANMPAAAVLRGDTYMAQRRFSDAAAAYAAELKAAPSSTLALRSATALNAAGGQDQAAQQLRTWMAQNPEDADVAQVLATLDIAARRPQEAERNLQIVLAKQPNNPVALNNFAWVLQLRSDPRARAMAQRAYLLAPSPETADTLGWIMTAQGDAAGGLTLLRQASSARPNDSTVQFHLAQALSGTGQKDEAVRVLTPIVNAPAEFDDKPAARQLLQQLQGQR